MPQSVAERQRTFRERQRAKPRPVPSARAMELAAFLRERGPVDQDDAHVHMGIASRVTFDQLVGELSAAGIAVRDAGGHTKFLRLVGDVRPYKRFRS